jgi:hypothetical protein
MNAFATLREIGSNGKNIAVMTEDGCSPAKRLYSS